MDEIMVDARQIWTAVVPVSVDWDNPNSADPVVLRKAGEIAGRELARLLLDEYCKRFGHTFDDKSPKAETLCTVCLHFIGAVPA